jgi:hypothetical protein
MQTLASFYLYVGLGFRSGGVAHVEMLFHTNILALVLHRRLLSLSLSVHDESL